MNSYLSFLNHYAPQIILIATSVLVLFTDFALVRRHSLATRSGVASLIAVAGCTAAAIWIGHTPLFYLRGHVLHGEFEHPANITLLVVTGCVLLLFSANRFTEHPAEFNFLILTATASAMVLMGAQDLLTFFLSLEILSLCLYALTAFDKKNLHSSEAALKYFLFGGISAAFLLFGFSFLYGASGFIELRPIALACQVMPSSPLLLVGIVCILVGFGFKVAAVPFHFWAPDAYKGAPAPAAAFIASVSKIASFSAFFGILSWEFPHYRGSAAWGGFHAGIAPILALLAVLSMLLGNLVAIRQTSMRRLIAYSAIAHAGYILLSFVANTEHSGTAMGFYVLTYSIGTVGLFAVTSAVEEADGTDAFSSFDGLVRRSPSLAICLFIFLLSLAGIPPLAGFFAKFFVFLAVLESPGHIWLAAIALASSAIGLYYYLRILKRAFLSQPAANSRPLQVHVAVRIVAVFAAIAVLFLGATPNRFLFWLTNGTIFY